MKRFTRYNLKSKHINWKISVVLVILLTCSNCNKLVEIPNPINSVSEAQVFSSDASATYAMMGIYSYFSNSSAQIFSNSATTIYAGESADELTDQTPGSEANDFFLSNTLSSQVNGGQCLGLFWQPAYFGIYSANSIISGVQASNSLSAGVRRQLLGEAKFIRAFSYFYLTNLFGNVPLDLSDDFNQTILLSNSSQSDIYAQIISDLHDAQALMVGDFSFTNGQPIRANKWAATALLARVYLFQKNWAGADSAASAVISSGLFTLASNLDSVFLPNNSEAILQLQTLNNYPFATSEGYFLIPPDSNAQANCWITPQLFNSFEPSDLRKLDWIDSTDFGGIYYYYPFKYKIAVGSAGTISENYTLLRLAEQYLIKAEADANLGQFATSVTNLNIIRTRAGLNELAASLSQPQLLSAIQHENQVEFFAELGHRWMDLRRWGIALQTLDTIYYKMGNIDSTQLLYPIPISELQTDPNLRQNPGY